MSAVEFDLGAVALLAKGGVNLVYLKSLLGREWSGKGCLQGVKHPKESMGWGEGKHRDGIG